MESTVADRLMERPTSYPRLSSPASAFRDVSKCISFSCMSGSSSSASDSVRSGCAGHVSATYSRNTTECTRASASPFAVARTRNQCFSAERVADGGRTCVSAKRSSVVVACGPSAARAASAVTGAPASWRARITYIGARLRNCSRWSTTTDSVGTRRVGSTSREYDSNKASATALSCTGASPFRFREALRQTLRCRAPRTPPTTEIVTSNSGRSSSWSARQPSTTTRGSGRVVVASSKERRVRVAARSALSCFTSYASSRPVPPSDTHGRSAAGTFRYASSLMISTEVGPRAATKHRLKHCRSAGAPPTPQTTAGEEARKRGAAFAFSSALRRRAKLDIACAAPPRGTGLLDGRTLNRRSPPAAGTTSSSKPSKMPSPWHAARASSSLSLSLPD
mmetsp:Transcript_26235/g.86166  ORF Transcript_26235/g.86166 Transcript_26235/m.86166 type:complete len:394 (+) Transcript_26235:594-1775(+)